MPKFHIEIDARTTETAIFEINAENMEAAIDKALGWEIDPIEMKVVPDAELVTDKDKCFEIK